MHRKLKLKGGVYKAPYKGCTMHKLTFHCVYLFKLECDCKREMPNLLIQYS